LSLSGLVPGRLYYFRIFGSSNPVSQRTGLYCFCGTTGLSNVILPVAMSGFHGSIAADAVHLEWTTTQPGDYLYFDVQRSSDGSSFATIGRVDGTGPTGATAAYSYIDQPGSTDTSYYRLKGYTDEEQYTYSTIIAVRQPAKDRFRFFFDTESKNLQITVAQSTKMAILTASGSIVKTLVLIPGGNSISIADLTAGIYFLHDLSSNTTRRFIVLNR